MFHLNPLPKHIPPGTKYVVEARGVLVRRFLEFPDGRILELAPRKAQSCRCQRVRKFARDEPARAAA
jgi:hypothetical protein